MSCLKPQSSISKDILNSKVKSIYKSVHSKGFLLSLKNLAVGAFLVLLFAYFAFPLQFELRVQDLKSDLENIEIGSEDSDLPSLCGKNKKLLISNLNEHGEINSPRDYGSIALITYDGGGFENWETELSSQSFRCSKGSEEGEIENHQYCDGRGNPMKLKRTVTDEEGEIIETDSLKIKEIELNENDRVEDLKCSKN
ncbi:MAG: hypothetical protein BRC29_03385 [Nanohaloarchaea archaeon SW_7_43_1]|nr:MAG: hypothetical protein BRC29_03385 [Nanohaloarchaea archaeon SW_7_43_1]